MPIYEYRCRACNEEFEELVSAGAERGPDCPSCGAADPQRRFSLFATEWKPGNVAWHKMPNKHDLGGMADSRPTAAFPKDFPSGKKKAGKGDK